MSDRIKKLIIESKFTEKVEKSAEDAFEEFKVKEPFSGEHRYYVGGYMDGAKFVYENLWNTGYPKKSDVYLCCDLNHSSFLQYPFTCFFDAEEYTWYIIVGTLKIRQEVTHWMYIPHVKDWNYPSKF